MAEKPHHHSNNTKSRRLGDLCLLCKRGHSIFLYFPNFRSGSGNIDSLYTWPKIICTAKTKIRLAELLMAVSLQQRMRLFFRHNKYQFKVAGENERKQESFTTEQSVSNMPQCLFSSDLEFLYTNINDIMILQGARQ